MRVIASVAKQVIARSEASHCERIEASHCERSEAKKRSFRRNGLTSNDCLPYEKSSCSNSGLNYSPKQVEFSAFLQTFVLLFLTTSNDLPTPNDCLLMK